MLAPARVARAAGSVVAIATSPDDPSVEAASLITAAAGERLVVVDVRIAADALRVERKREGNDRIQQIDEGPAEYTAEAAPHALRGLTERLTVISRGTIRNEVALAIALARGAPVLSLGPRVRGRSI